MVKTKRVALLVFAVLFSIFPQKSFAAAKSLAKDPRISKVATFATPESCLTIDKTSGQGHSYTMTSGFPRPESSIPGKASAKILLLPVNFSDYKFTQADKTSYEGLFKNASNFFSKQSFGRFKPTFVIPPESLWVTLPGETRDHGIAMNGPQQDNGKVAVDTIAAAPAELNLSSYDAVIVATGFYKETGGAQAFGSANMQSKSGLVKNAMLIFGRGMVSWMNVVHEMGHSLFGLEDLYLFQKRDDSGPQNTKNFTAWDLMAGTTPDFSGWNKLLMGFIHQEDLRCVAKKTKKTIFLSATNLIDAPKLGVINLEPGVSICFEAKKDFDGRAGLLVYEVDTNFDHGNGPFWGEDDLVKTGMDLDFEGARFKVLTSSQAGVLVQVNA